MTEEKRAELIARFRKERMVADDAEYAEGCRAGELWAKRQSTSWPELRAVGEAEKNEVSTEEIDLAAHVLSASEVLTGLVASSAEIDNFWRDALDTDSHPTVSTVRGFYDGALEVYNDVVDEVEAD